MAIPRVASLGALALGGVMLNATVTHVIAAEYPQAIGPLVFFGMLVLIGHVRRHAVLERFSIRELSHLFHRGH